METIVNQAVISEPVLKNLAAAFYNVENPRIFAVYHLLKKLFFQAIQEELLPVRGCAFDAFLEPVKAVVNVRFILSQQCRNGSGREAGCGEKIQQKIFFFPLGEGGAELDHHVIGRLVERLLKRFLC